MYACFLFVFPINGNEIKYIFKILKLYIWSCLDYFVVIYQKHEYFIKNKKCNYLSTPN